MIIYLTPVMHMHCTVLTINQAVAGLQVADDADGSDGEHAAQAKNVAA